MSEFWLTSLITCLRKDIKLERHTESTQTCFHPLSMCVYIKDTYETVPKYTLFQSPETISSCWLDADVGWISMDVFFYTPSSSFSILLSNIFIYISASSRFQDDKDKLIMLVPIIPLQLSDILNCFNTTNNN